MEEDRQESMFRRDSLPSFAKPSVRRTVITARENLSPEEKRGLRPESIFDRDDISSKSIEKKRKSNQNLYTISFMAFNKLSSFL